MTAEHPEMCPGCAHEGTEALRCVRDVLLGREIGARDSLARALASVAAAAYTTKWRGLQGLDEAEGRKAALAEVEKLIETFTLTALDDGQIPPLLPPPEDWPS